MQNNFVKLYGYVTKTILKDKVGSVYLKVEEEYKGEKKETSLSITCFGRNLEEAKKLNDFQYISVEGRLSRRKNGEQWQTEIIADKLNPTNAYNDMKGKVDSAFKEEFAW